MPRQSFLLLLPLLLVLLIANCATHPTTQSGEYYGEVEAVHAEAAEEAAVPAAADEHQMAQTEIAVEQPQQAEAPEEQQQQAQQEQQPSKDGGDEMGDNRTFLRNGMGRRQQNSSSATMVAPRNYFGWLDLESNADGVNAAQCYDSRLSSFINNGLHYYSHNMGQLSKYIMDQIRRAGYPGFWFVHAAMIGGQTQGLQWQSQSNGDIFVPSSRHGCYYHDTQTYIVIIRY